MLEQNRKLVFSVRHSAGAGEDSADGRPCCGGVEVAGRHRAVSASPVRDKVRSATSYGCVAAAFQWTIADTSQNSVLCTPCRSPTRCGAERIRSAISTSISTSAVGSHSCHCASQPSSFAFSHHSSLLIVHRSPCEHSDRRAPDTVIPTACASELSQSHRVHVTVPPWHATGHTDSECNMCAGRQASIQRGGPVTDSKEKSSDGCPSRSAYACEPSDET